MSKIVYICSRNSGIISSFKKDIEILSRKLMPDNIKSVPPKVFEEDGIFYGIFNPNDSVLIKNSSVCLGGIFDNDARWWEPLQEYPDGTYAIFRSNNDYIELLSDVVASRTIWYFMNDDIFISSTSQKAIIYFLRSFNFNRDVLPWMLLNGNLGINNSWDTRIKSLPGDSSILLDRKSWTIKIRTNPCVFIPENRSDKEHIIKLKNVLEETFRNFKFDNTKWVLLLSGGFDSRGILCLLNNSKNLKTITWGLKSSINEKNNDAYIAKSLADYFKLEHVYFQTDITSENLESFFNRFFTCGQGRVDLISAYMDGFKIWKTLFESGIHGIIRGDADFGTRSVASPMDVRRRNLMNINSDFYNLKNLEEFGIPEQKFPHFLLQKENESLVTWLDRTYQEYRMPLVLSALNDFKLPFVETISPLSSRKIIYKERSFPDHLRKGRKQWETFVRSVSPPIEFSKHVADDALENILNSGRIMNFIREELYSENVFSIIPKEFINYVFKNIEVKEKENIKRTIKQSINPYIPSWFKHQIRKIYLPIKIDFKVLAFRTFLIYKMHKILLEAANRVEISKLRNILLTLSLMYYS